MESLALLDFARELVIFVMSHYNILCSGLQPYRRSTIRLIRFTTGHARVISSFLHTKGSAIMALFHEHSHTEIMDELKFRWCALKVIDIFTTGPYSSCSFIRCCSLLAIIAAYSVEHGYQNAPREVVYFILYAAPKFGMKRKLYDSAWYKDSPERNLL